MNQDPNTIINIYLNNSLHSTPSIPSLYLSPLQVPALVFVLGCLFAPLRGIRSPIVISRFRYQQKAIAFRHMNRQRRTVVAILRDIRHNQCMTFIVKMFSDFLIAPRLM